MGGGGSPAIVALRSCMSLTTTTSPTDAPLTSTGSRATGITPRTFPPLSNTVFDTFPIRPMEPPPYTRRTPRLAISSPSSAALAKNSGELPEDDPQYTHTLLNLLSMEEDMVEEEEEDVAF